MKKLILIFILTLSFHPLAKANDVSDLQIEGMSVGDSLLNFFDKNTIKNGIIKNHNYNDDSFFTIEIYNHKSFNEYQNVSFNVKKNDNTFKIYDISGFNFYTTGAQECLDKVDKVSIEISDVLKNLNKTSNTGPHIGDPTNKSITKQVIYWHDSGSINIECYDWSEKITQEKSWMDNFSVGVSTKEFNNWLQKKAYN